VTRHRPSDLEPAIPDDDAPVPPASRPTWWRVRRVRAIAFACLGLAVALSLFSSYQSWRTAETSGGQAEAVDQRLSVLEQDLAERKAQRDAERDQAAARAAEDQERINSTLCELLGQLPDDAPRLDLLRDTLGCDQLGVAPSALVDGEKTSSGAAAPPDASFTSPATPSAAGTEPTRVAGSQAAGTPLPPASPTQDQPVPTGGPDSPADDRGAVGDLLCTLRLLC
jgi:hypothetical protein